jgi:hypothetical protein
LHLHWLVQDEGGLQMSDEKRRFTRIPLKINAELTVNDVSYSIEEISNLSVGGCQLAITKDLEPETACRVKISLSGTSDEMSIMIEGEISRCDPGAVAVKFTRIDIDSLFHLHNIIRYNSPDPDTVEKEIHEHPGLV